MLPSVPILPVLAAAAAVFVVGALWYSPLVLGRQWVAAHGYTEEKIREMRASAGRAYLVSFVCYVVMAAAVSVLVARIGVTSLKGGLKLGLFLGVGFAATLGLTANMFSEKKLSTWMIDAAYQIVYMMVMGAILAVWR
jgi:hypothetical protein